MRMRFAVVLCTLGAGLLPARHCAADVLVVDENGGGDYTNLPDAVDAANGGDVILVRALTFHPLGFVLVWRKSLSLVADVGTRVPVPLLRVAETPPGETVLVRGFDLGSTGGSGLEVIDDANLWVEDCTITGSDGVFGIDSTSGTTACKVLDSKVVLARCTIFGGNGIDANPPYSGAGHGAPAIFAARSTLTVHACVCVGGRAGNYTSHSPESYGGNGGNAIEAHDGPLYVEGCSLTGGDGGDGTDGRFDLGYAGGDGIQLTGTQNLALRVRDNQYFPGAPGADDGTLGNPGIDLDAPPQTISSYSGTARSMTLDGPTREFGTAHLHYEGVTGDRLLVFAGLASAQAPLGSRGDWLTGLPLFGPFFLGRVNDAGGVLDLDVPIGDLGLSKGQGFLLYEQCLVLGADGALQLGGPTTHCLLDDSY